MSDHEILMAIKKMCEEAFDPDKAVSDLHRAQVLANVYMTIIHRGANLLPQVFDEFDQITIDEALEELRN